MPRLECLDHPGARPIVLGVEAQGFAKVLHGLLRPPLVQQRPSLVGMGDIILGRFGQRFIQQRLRLGLAA